MTVITDEYGVRWKVAVGDRAHAIVSKLTARGFTNIVLYREVIVSGGELPPPEHSDLISSILSLMLPTLDDTTTASVFLWLCRVYDTCAALHNGVDWIGGANAPILQTVNGEEAVNEEEAGRDS